MTSTMLYKTSSRLIWFYFILLLLYFGQANLFGEDSTIGKFFILPVIGINAYYLIKCVQSRFKLSIISWFIAFFTITLLYYLFGSLIILNVSPYQQFLIFKTITLAITCIFPIYVWINRGYRLTNILLLFALAYFLIVFLGGNIQISTKDGTVNNVGYYYLSFIPFLLLIYKKIYLKIGLCALLNILIISSAKRGAIVCLGISDILFFTYLVRARLLPKGLIPKLVGLAIIGVASIYVYQTFTSNSFVLERFEQMNEGQLSGRDIIYANLINNWIYNPSLIDQLFGGGFCKAPTVTGGEYAHNDWLQLLTDLGLFGVIIYAGLILNMFKCIFKAPTKKLKYSITIVVIIWFVKTLFSMSYLDENNFMFTLLLGYLCAQKNMTAYERKQISMA